MGLDPVTGKGLDDAVIVIDHHIEAEAGPCHGRGLEDVGMEDVAVRHVGAAHIGVGAVAETGVQGLLVVALDGLVTGDAGQQHLAAATEARQEVIDHAAGDDDLVTGHGVAVEPHRRAAAGIAHMHQMGGIAAIVVDDADAAADVLAQQAGLFVAHMGTVRARGRDDEDVTVGDAAGIEFFHHHVDVDRGRLPQAGHIGHQQADLLAGVDDVLQTGRADGMAQGLTHGLIRFHDRQGHRIGLQHGRQVLVGHRHGPGNITIVQRMF